MSRTEDFFESICNKYYKDVYKYVVFVTGDKDAADDIVQDTFVVVYKNIEKVLKHNNIGGFIFKTAQNIIKNYKKELYKRILKEVSIDEGTININDKRSEVESYINSEINEYEYLTEILSSLSDDKKDLYKWYYVDNIPMKEIAEREGIEYTALRMKYVRLRKEIKEKVREISENKFVT